MSCSRQACWGGRLGAARGTLGGVIKATVTRDRARGGAAAAFPRDTTGPGRHNGSQVDPALGKQQEATRSSGDEVSARDPVAALLANLAAQVNQALGTFPLSDMGATVDQAPVRTDTTRSVGAAGGGTGGPESPEMFRLWEQVESTTRMFEEALSEMRAAAEALAELSLPAPSDAPAPAVAQQHVPPAHLNGTAPPVVSTPPGLQQRSAPLEAAPITTTEDVGQLFGDSFEMTLQRQEEALAHMRRATDDLTAIRHATLAAVAEHQQATVAAEAVAMVVSAVAVAAAAVAEATQALERQSVGPGELTTPKPALLLEDPDAALVGPLKVEPGAADEVEEDMERQQASAAGPSASAEPADTEVAELRAQLESTVLLHKEALGEVRRVTEALEDMKRATGTGAAQEQEGDAEPGPPDNGAQFRPGDVRVEIDTAAEIAELSKAADQAVSSSRAAAVYVPLAESAELIELRAQLGAATRLHQEALAESRRVASALSDVAALPAEARTTDPATQQPVVDDATRLRGVHATDEQPAAASPAAGKADGDVLIDAGVDSVATTPAADVVSGDQAGRSAAALAAAAATEGEAPTHGAADDTPSGATPNASALQHAPDDEPVASCGELGDSPSPDAPASHDWQERSGEPALPAAAAVSPRGESLELQELRAQLEVAVQLHQEALAESRRVMQALADSTQAPSSTGRPPAEQSVAAAEAAVDLAAAVQVEQPASLASVSTVLDSSFAASDATRVEQLSLELPSPADEATTTVEVGAPAIGGGAAGGDLADDVIDGAEAASVNSASEATPRPQIDAADATRVRDVAAEEAVNDEAALHEDQALAAPSAATEQVLVPPEAAEEPAVEAALMEPPPARSAAIAQAKDSTESAAVASLAGADEAGAVGTADRFDDEVVHDEDAAAAGGGDDEDAEAAEAPQAAAADLGEQSVAGDEVLVTVPAAEIAEMRQLRAQLQEVMRLHLEALAEVRRATDALTEARRPPSVVSTASTHPPTAEEDAHALDSAAADMSGDAVTATAMGVSSAPADYDDVTEVQDAVPSSADDPWAVSLPVQLDGAAPEEDAAPGAVVTVSETTDEPDAASGAEAQVADDDVAAEECGEALLLAGHADVAQAAAAAVSSADDALALADAEQISHPEPDKPLLECDGEPGSAVSGLLQPEETVYESVEEPAGPHPSSEEDSAAAVAESLPAVEARAAVKAAEAVLTDEARAPDAAGQQQGPEAASDKVVTQGTPSASAAEVESAEMRELRAQLAYVTRLHQEALAEIRQAAADMKRRSTGDAPSPAAAPVATAGAESGTSEARSDDASKVAAGVEPPVSPWDLVVPGDMRGKGDDAPPAASLQANDDTEAEAEGPTGSHGAASVMEAASASDAERTTLGSQQALTMQEHEEALLDIRLATVALSSMSDATGDRVLASAEGGVAAPSAAAAAAAAADGTSSAVDAAAPPGSLGSVEQAAAPVGDEPAGQPEAVDESMAATSQIAEAALTARNVDLLAMAGSPGQDVSETSPLGASTLRHQEVVADMRRATRALTDRQDGTPAHASAEADAALGSHEAALQGPAGLSGEQQQECQEPADLTGGQQQDQEPAVAPDEQQQQQQQQAPAPTEHAGQQQLLIPIDPIAFQPVPEAARALREAEGGGDPAAVAASAAALVLLPAAPSLVLSPEAAAAAGVAAAAEATAAAAAEAAVASGTSGAAGGSANGAAAPSMFDTGDEYAAAASSKITRGLSASVGADDNAMGQSTVDSNFDTADEYAALALSGTGGQHHAVTASTDAATCEDIRNNFDTGDEWLGGGSPVATTTASLTADSVSAEGQDAAVTTSDIVGDSALDSSEGATGGIVAAIGAATSGSQVLLAEQTGAVSSDEASPEGTAAGVDSGEAVAGIAPGEAVAGVAPGLVVSASEAQAEPSADASAPGEVTAAAESVDMAALRAQLEITTRLHQEALLEMKRATDALAEIQRATAALLLKETQAAQTSSLAARPSPPPAPERVEAIEPSQASDDPTSGSSSASASEAVPEPALVPSSRDGEAGLSMSDAGSDAEADQASQEGQQPEAAAGEVSQEGQPGAAVGRVGPAQGDEQEEEEGHAPEASVEVVTEQADVSSESAVAEGEESGSGPLAAAVASEACTSAAPEATTDSAAGLADGPVAADEAAAPTGSTDAGDDGPAANTAEQPLLASSASSCGSSAADGSADGTASGADVTVHATAAASAAEVGAGSEERDPATGVGAERDVPVPAGAVTDPGSALRALDSDATAGGSASADQTSTTVEQAIEAAVSESADTAQGAGDDAGDVVASDDVTTREPAAAAAGGGTSGAMDQTVEPAVAEEEEDDASRSGDTESAVGSLGVTDDMDAAAAQKLLVEAAAAGHAERIVQLLRRGVDVNLQDTNGASALYLAAQRGQTAAIKELLAGGAAVDLPNKIGSTALFTAAYNGRLEAVQLLLAAGADANATDKNGASPLFVAAQNGHGDVVSALVAGGANSQLAKNGTTPLFTAAYNGRLAAVTALLSGGGKVDVPDKSGASPLFVAAQNGHGSVVGALLAGGASVDAAKGGATPLLVASYNGHAEAVQLLLAGGAEVERADQDGRTPLYMAALKGHTDVMRALLMHGARVDVVVEGGWTPLILVAANGNLDAVKALLVGGASVDVAVQDGSTALLMASQNGCVEVVEVLLAAGADVDLAEQDGSTPLSIAAQEGHADVVRVLLAGGAAVDLADKEGYTPLAVAVQEGHDEVVKALLAAAADIDRTRDFVTNRQITKLQQLLTEIKSAGNA